MYRPFRAVAREGSGERKVWCSRDWLVVNAFLSDREKFGASVSEQVAERDGLLEGDSDPAGLPDDDGVEGGFVRRGQAEEFVLLVRAAGRVGIESRNDELSVGAIFAASGFLVLLGEEAVPRTWWILDLDGNLEQGEQIHDVESARAPRAGVVAVYCLSGTGGLISMIAY